MGKTRYRKQRGGSLWTRFPTLSFQLEFPDGSVKRDDEMFSWPESEKDPDKLKKSKYTLSMFEGNEAKPLYTLRFTPHGRGNQIASVDWLESKKKTELFKHGSFLIMYKFLEILKSIGIPFVFFTVATAGNLWKLYAHYHKMGFVCRKDIESENDETNFYETMNLHKYNERRAKNEMNFSKILKNVITMSEENQGELGWKLHLKCHIMFGTVERVMEKIQKYVESQQGGKKTRKNRGRK